MVVFDIWTLLEDLFSQPFRGGRKVFGVPDILGWCHRHPAGCGESREPASLHEAGGVAEGSAERVVDGTLGGRGSGQGLVTPTGCGGALAGRIRLEGRAIASHLGSATGSRPKSFFAMIL